MNNKYFDEVREVISSHVQDEQVDEFVKLLKLASGMKNTVFVAGNGGSDCDARHFAQDCISYILNNDGVPIKTHVVGANSGVLTALANDFCYDKAVVKELKLYARKQKGDILVLFSGSGNSKNLLEAAKWAKNNGVIVVSFVGFDGGYLKNISDICFHIKSETWGVIHGCHSLIFHYILDKYLEQ